MVDNRYTSIGETPGKNHKANVQNTEESKEPPEPTITDDHVFQKVLEESLIDTRIEVDLSFVAGN